VAYFCVECGAFQRVAVRSCPVCGAEREDPTRIDPFARSRRSSAEIDAVDELPEEVISRRRYFWFKLTRPWRRLWMRGLLWRTLLLSVSAVVIGVPLAGAVYWIVGQRCDSSQDVACSATVVRLVTPVSADFATQLSQPVSMRDIALAAELYDAVTLVGLAWADDQAVSQQEVVKVSAGDSDICLTAVECIALIRSGKNIDYDGVSGSAYLNPAGLRGTHLANQQRRKPSTLSPDPRRDRSASDRDSRVRVSEAIVPGTVLSVLVRTNVAWVSESVGLALARLQEAGVQLEVRVESFEFTTIDSLGQFVVVLESAISDQTLQSIEASGRLVITVGSEWRVVPGSRTWLRLSPHPSLLAETVVARLRFNRTVVIVGRCGDQSPAITGPIQRRLTQRGSRGVVRYQCIDAASLETISIALESDLPVTLVVATPYNPLGLLTTMLETGYIGKVDDVIVVESRVTRLVEPRDISGNP